VIVRYSKKFLKQLAQTAPETRKKIEIFAFEELPSAGSLGELGKIEKMQGYKEYYKVRFGSYRVGMKCQNGIITLMVAMDRKEIYTYFP
jgi:mRNA interferase RelE/StbE